MPDRAALEAGPERRSLALAAPGQRRAPSGLNDVRREKLPPLSPAVEMAAHRSAGEALANVLRHSDAQHCGLTMSAADDVEVVVSDDGKPPAPTWLPGLGMRSIAERAEELGGCVTAGPPADGWEVGAHLPVQPSLRGGNQGARDVIGTDRPFDPARAGGG